ncbi:hypothetical protein [uncultured Mucilaginibacter sp.]|uniref:hypothetical protein n=1 Tax=uncultured Mucilaginibacter sp. TaxID=797541 RepID=UPI00262AF35F|nr:hypothetical protein [uncultured Mucilaginibacter sp.]
MILKTTTKWIAAVAAMVILLGGSQVEAQMTTTRLSSAGSNNALRLGLGLEGGYATKNFSNFELGGTARLQYDLSNNLSLMLTPGFYHFFAKNGEFQSTDKGLYSNDLNMIPVKVGLKSFFAQNFYLSGEAGAGFELNHAQETKLILSPGIGYAGNKGLDLGLRYENFSGNHSNYGIIGLRLAYGFKL